MLKMLKRRGKWTEETIDQLTVNILENPKRDYQAVVVVCKQ